MSHVSDGDGHLDHYQRGSIRAPTTSSTATRYNYEEVHQDLGVVELEQLWKSHARA